MIRVAIIGAGIGAEHLAGYRALPERFAVRALCDLDTDRARAVTQGDGTIAIGGDLDAVLADPEIDLVDVCLPPHLHVPVSQTALKAGKHVICEKPIAASLKDVDALAEAARSAGRRVFPVFQYRYGIARAQLAALRNAGFGGTAYAASLETHWNRGGGYYDNPWRGRWTGEGGGAVLSHAIHNHDLLCEIFGPVVALSATIATRVNEIETEDCAAILMRHENGAVSTSSITLGAATDETRLRVTFADFTAESGTKPYAPVSVPWRFIARDPQRQGEIDEVLANVCAPRMGFPGFFEAIADALDGNPGHEVTLEDGRRSIELVTAIYDAARSGGRVMLPLGPDAPLYNGWLP